MERWDAVSAHENLASTLSSWRIALQTINKSAEVAVYTAAAAQAVEHLRACTTLDELLSAYFSSSPDLTLLLARLCTQANIPLRPHRLLAASCALRLRELIGASGG
jgi:hypothetical protein